MFAFASLLTLFCYKGLVDCIDEYLQAFESRRSQCLELKEDCSIRDITATEACDYVQFIKEDKDEMCANDSSRCEKKY